MWYNLQKKTITPYVRWLIAVPLLLLSLWIVTPLLPLFIRAQMATEIVASRIPPGAPQLSCYTPAIFFTAAILLFCLFVCLENHLRGMTTTCYRHMREMSCCPIFQSHPQYIMPLCTYHLPSMLFWLFWASAGAEFAFLTNHPNLHVYW